MRTRAAASACALAFAFAFVGCAKRDAGAPAAMRAVDGGQAVDDATMAFLSEARALHHEANVKEDERDVRGAIAAVTRVVKAQRPHAGERIPEIEEVLADAYARIAELEVRAGDLAAADEAARAGLEHAPDATYFRGHLLEVRGIVDESRAASLADAGNEAGAAKARAEAMRWLEEAVSVQERVIGGALADDGGAGEGGGR